MTKYYKSRYADKPVVYVQDEGQWRAYAPRGVLQRSMGLIPEVILAQTVEISQDEAQTLIGFMRAEAERIRAERAEAARSSEPAAPSLAPQAPVTAAPGTAAAVPAAPGTAEVAHASSPSPRSRRPRWLPYALAGGAAVVVLVVAVVLAVTGAFGGGSGTTVSTGAPGAIPTEVVATVGGRSITREQFDQRVAGFEAQYPGRVPDKKNAPDRYKLFQQDILEYMITYELATQKAEQLNIMVTDQDVQTQIDLILNTSFSGDQAKFDAALKEQGITMDQFKQTYEESTLFEKVYNEVTKDVTTVPDSDIQAYYDKHTSDSYAGKSLDEVKEEIRSALLDARKKEAWQAWIDQAKAGAGVTYAEG